MKRRFPIDEHLTPALNDTALDFRIRGTSGQNPVLLFLHGGPGVCDRHFVLEDQAALTDVFTLACFDQRGSGKSYTREQAARHMDMETVLGDAAAAVEWLLERYGQQKLYLVGHSYGSYLGALQNGGVTLPIFYFMLCFRAMFELSLQRLGRQREFRADRIAAETTSPEAFAGAMLRTVAYSKYRQQVERELFDQERALQSVDIGRRVECGFAAFAASFASDPDLGREETTHPFDSHPPLSQRLDAVGAGPPAAHAAATPAPRQRRA